MTWFVAGCGFSSTPPSTASNCPLHHVLGFFYCDGFEDGLDSRYQTNGTSIIDRAHRYRGDTALLMARDTGQANPGMMLAASASDFINIDPQEVHLRVFVFVVGEPLAGAIRLVTLGGLQVYMTDGDLVLGGFDRSGTSMPMDRWVCLELALVQEGTVWTGSMSVDGLLPVVMGPRLGNVADGFSLQLQHSDLPRALDVWFDELVLDHRTIGCGS